MGYFIEAVLFLAAFAGYLAWQKNQVKLKADAATISAAAKKL